MVGSYSLTVTRPTRIGRLTPPHADGVRAAEAREQALTLAMAGPGANQMIGYRLGAQLDREQARDDYNLAMQEHDRTLAEMREQDMARRAEELRDQRNHALRTAAINNPGGAAVSGDEEVYRLVTPEFRELERRRREADIERLNRVGQPRGGSGSADPVLRPGEVLRNRTAVERQFETAEANVQRAFVQREAALRRQLQNAATRAEREAVQRELDGLAAQRDTAIGQLRERRNQTLQGLPSLGPDGRIVMPGATAQPTPQTPTPAQPTPAQPTPSPAPTTLTPQQQTLLNQARQALREGRQRAGVENILRQNGIDPGLLNQ
jgi:hypothetical protein